jgi:pimeloyl-ACP methyl ester carboxylesterase
MSRLLGAALLLVFGGGCMSTLPDRAARMERAYVYYLDGAGGGSALGNWGGGVRSGLTAAGYAGSGEMFSWETGWGILADQVASVAYKRQKAGELSQRITNFTQQCPAASVHVIGLSAGTAIATFALEVLPDGLMLENLILLSSSLSADYDVTKALRHVRGKVYVFTSQRDGMLLYLEPLFGSADRRQTARVIGVCGLSVPADAPADIRRQYDKVVCIPWREEFAEQGDRGEHVGVVKTRFVQKYIAPLILPDPTSTATSGADTVDNPDYTRWASFGVGSTATFEGSQVLDGVDQRVCLTVTLVARHADSLLVERRFSALGPERPAPCVRQFFARARIQPTEHPLTHPLSTVRDLPGEVVQVGAHGLDCAVRTISAPADFPEWGCDLSACLWTNEAIPGGVAGYDMTATLDGRPMKARAHLTEYRAVPH